WAVSGTAGNDVWALGPDGVLHWDGTAWSPSPGFPASGRTSGFPGDIWAAAPNDVWVVGNYNVVVHFDGSSWTALESSTDVSHALFGVWSDGTTTWAVGEGERIQKFSGGVWTTIQGAGGSSIGFVAVMGIGSDIWAVGQDTVRSMGGGPFETLTAPQGS